MSLKPVVVALALLLSASTAALAAESLTIVSAGGALQEAQRKAYFEPFAKATGTQVVEDEFNGEMSKVAAMVQSNSVSWDVVHPSSAEAMAACDQGIIVPIDRASLDNPDDFLPGALQECAVADELWSMVYAYDKSKLNPAPSTIQDFFDTTKFPGRRAIRKGPDFIMEQALIADGVPPEQVYEVLGTEEGVDRAFAKLDTIKKDVVWWEAGAQPPQLLADGEVVMAQAYSGRIQNAIDTESKPFQIVWDGQVYDYDFWVIPKGAKQEAALNFIKFATSPEQGAKLTQYISYPPARRSALAFVPKESLGKLPTATENFEGKRPLNYNTEFWASNLEEINKRFQLWLAK